MSMPVSLASEIGLLDVVALREELNDAKIPAGTEGTVVEVLSSGAFEVEFTDTFGNTVYEGAVKSGQLRLVYSAVHERGGTEAAIGIQQDRAKS